MFEKLMTIETVCRMLLFYAPICVMVLLATPLTKYADFNAVTIKEKAVAVISGTTIFLILIAGFYGAFKLASSNEIVQWMVNLL